MARKKGCSETLIWLFFFLFIMPVRAETISVVSRYSYYSGAENAEVLLAVKERNDAFPVHVILKYGNLQLKDTVLGKTDSSVPCIIPFPISGFSQGKTNVDVHLSFPDGFVKDTSVVLWLLPPKRNGIRLDRLSGMLIADGLPFFPFGFYNYWPVQKTLPEEEVVRGFNMISPYQRIERKTFRQRKKYMDRCAELGMKVHYNLLSVSGGGGVGSGRLHGLSEEEKRDRLIREVRAMMDHPALLSWYIADEPVGQGVPPEPLEETYRLIKSIDPYHPVSMVFMAPEQAWRYRNAMDIVMADPYPVPNRPVTEAGWVIDRLKETFYPEKPVWLVPQAFGGNEWWPREPTPGEVRVMTYLGIIKGATGIQYFIRHGLNGFPKSLQTWNECGSVAMETAELTPFYAASSPTRLRVPGTMNASFWQKGDSTLIVCVNPDNEPGTLKLKIPPGVTASEAVLPFENRSVRVRNGMLQDMIDGMSTRIYILVRNEGSMSPPVDSLNLIVDPGFEVLPVPGIPSATYFRVGKDRGSTAFVDSRVFHSGNHALRIISPAKKKGGAVSFFPVEMEFGKSYRFSFWAKAAPQDSLWFYRGFLYRLFHKRPGPVQCAVSVGTLADTTFILDHEWKKYELTVNLSDSSVAVSRVVPGLKLDTRGTAWFDDLRFIPVLDIHSMVEVPGKRLKVEVLRHDGSGKIFYTLDGSPPAPDDQVYISSVLIDSSVTFRAALWKAGRVEGEIMRDFTIHRGVGHRIDIKYSPSQRYAGGGSNALLDGLTALPAYRDKRWTGFLQDDLDATIDLDSAQNISEISVSFLQQLHVWILYPVEVTFSVSADGREFREIYRWKPQDPEQIPGPEIMTVSWNGFDTARYIRVYARNTGICPPWSDGAGEKAWLFTDEIQVH